MTGQIMQLGLQIGHVHILMEHGQVGNLLKRRFFMAEWIYRYENKTKLYNGANPIEYYNSIKGNLPEIYQNMTFVLVAPDFQNGKFPIWNDENKNWDYIIDCRGKVAFDKSTLQEIKINFLGELPDNLTLDNPNSVELPIFDKKKNKFVTNETKKEIDNYQKEIEELKIELANSDYKVIKCSEASLSNEPIPYDLKELISYRNSLREQINELTKNINELEPINQNNQ
jgi:hypothetical protein